MRFKLLFIIPLILLGCMPPSIEKEAPAVNEVKTGSRFKIVLPENHEDGYTWQLNEDFDKSTLEALSPVWHGQKKGIYFTFKALSAGQTMLTFIKRKYTDTLAVKRFIVKTGNNSF
jgi:predicted secreted protein